MGADICDHCGGSYIYTNGRYVCQACGSYKPEEISNEEVTLLCMAYQKLRTARFKAARRAFDDIIQEYPENPSAYWGRLMAKYGVKYERDVDGRMIPTCYATSIKSVLNDSDYKKALQYADEENKRYYQEKAEYMERVRKEWAEKANKEKPYDIFICYKETDHNEKRTKDSVAAQKLYTHLTAKGYRVFFSRESLKDKIGEKYEPYIFNAISTAKIMIVYGSNPEYINSTWLKNEWRRYEKMIHERKKKPDSLILAYEGFSPKELSDVFSSRQGIEAGKKDFYSRLDKTIERILDSKKEGGKIPLVSEKKKSKKPFLIALLLLLTVIGSIYLIADESCLHIPVIIPEIAPTCDQTGLTEGKQCSVCKALLAEQKVTVLVSFDSGEDDMIINSKKVLVVGSEYGVLPILEKEGYSFCGWYLDDFKIESSTKLEIQRSHTLKARWIANRYTIQYDTDGGTVMGNSVYEYNTRTFSVESPVKSGYQFAGWKFYNADTGEAVDFSFGDNMPAHDIVAKAQWTYKFIDGLIIDNEDQKIGAGNGYHLDYFDLSELSAFMNDDYTFQFVIRVYMKEIHDGYQEIELANANNMILGGEKDYCYGGDGKKSDAGWSDYIYINVSGENCTSQMHMVYSAHGFLGNKWERQKIELSVTISKK